MILAVYYSFAPQSYGNRGQEKERDTHILSGGNGLCGLVAWVWRLKFHVGKFVIGPAFNVYRTVTSSF